MIHVRGKPVSLENGTILLQTGGLISPGEFSRVLGGEPVGQLGGYILLERVPNEVCSAISQYGLEKAGTVLASVLGVDNLVGEEKSSLLRCLDHIGRFPLVVGTEINSLGLSSTRIALKIISARPIEVKQ